MRPYQAARSVYNEYASDFVRGVRTFDDWAEYVEKFNSVGGNQLSVPGNRYQVTTKHTPGRPGILGGNTWFLLSWKRFMRVF